MRNNFPPPVLKKDDKKARLFIWVISIIVFWIYMFAESNELQMKHSWLYVLASLFVGLSFALPLFLYFRENKLATR